MWRNMRIITRNSLNLHKTSIIALDGLQVWSIPIIRECSITTAPWPKIPVRILRFFLSAFCPAGPQGANQMADWVSTVSHEYEELLASLPPLFKFLTALNGNKRGAQKRSRQERTKRYRRSVHGRGDCMIFFNLLNMKRWGILLRVSFYYDLRCSSIGIFHFVQLAPRTQRVL